jgi:hypothetical protein
LVRNRVTFEGPSAGEASGGFEDDGGFRLFERTMRVLAKEEVLVNEDMLEIAGGPGTVKA